MSRDNNIGHACTRQQCDAGRAGKLAMRWVPATGAPRDYTFSDLETGSNRVANALGGLGLTAGDPVFVFLPRLPEYYFAVLGALKARLLVGPLFSNFGGDALVDRLGNASARAVITKRSLLRKLLGVRSQLPSLRHLLVIDSDDDDPNSGVLSFAKLLTSASADFDCAPTPPNTPSLLHYTSGSTGKPKGVVHVHGSLPDQRDTTRSILGLGDSDRFWCTADPGWVTGTSYGIIGPWSNGFTQIQYGGNYDPTAWFRLLEQERITVWYTAPTALRMLLREDPSVFAPFDLTHLRHISSVGEPLNPEIVTWATRVLGKTVHDTWFQTETGAIRIAKAARVNK